MTRCESYPPCFGTIYFPTAPSFFSFWQNHLSFFFPFNKAVQLLVSQEDKCCKY